MRVSVRCISVGLMRAAGVRVRMVEEEDDEQACGHERGDEADRYRLDEEPFAPIGLGDHVGDRERGPDAQHEPQRNGHERGRLGEPLAPTVAALRLLVEPLRVCRFLPRTFRVGVGEVSVHPVDP